MGYLFKSLPALLWQAPILFKEDSFMKKMLALFVLAGMLATLTGCAGIYGGNLVTPSRGILYSELKAPMQVDVNRSIAGKKVGHATSKSILGLVAVGDSSIQAAALEGNITTINHVDYEFNNILGVVSEFTTVVYGE
jgi:hypothetical protein